MSGYAFTSNADLASALHEWGASEDAANATYGWISTWDVSRITDLDHAFQGPCLADANFNVWRASERVATCLPTRCSRFVVPPTHPADRRTSLDGT